MSTRASVIAPEEKGKDFSGFVVSLFFSPPFFGGLSFHSSSPLLPRASLKLVWHSAVNQPLGGQQETGGRLVEMGDDCH